MTEAEWTRKELLRGGTIMLLASCAMVGLVLVEIAMSFRERPDGPILRLFLLRIPSYSEAGYYMMMTVAALAMIGVFLGYYGFRWVRHARK